MKIKILNLNLLHGGVVYDHVINFIKDTHADIMTFQEAYGGFSPKYPKNFKTIGYLRELFPDYSYYFSPEVSVKNKVGKIDMGNLIFSKFPIIAKSTTFFDVPYGEYEYGAESGRTDFSNDPKNIQKVVLKTGLKNLNVFNMHGIWGFDGLDSPRRLKMSEKIINVIKNLDNVVLTGDFNVDEKSKTIGKIEKYLTNVFKGERVTSFNMKRKTNPSYGNTIVDFIFTSPNIQIIDHYTPQIDVSDHMPLVLLFEI